MKGRIGKRAITVRGPYEAKVRGGVDRDTQGNRCSTSGQSRKVIGTPAAGANPAPAPFTFVLQGQLPGGKNAVHTTRTGHRYPDPRFIDWRCAAIEQLPKPKDRPTFFGPVQLIGDYVPGDLRRRDVDAMLGALGHLLERAGIVHDDAQIVSCIWTPFPLNREHPRCTVTIRAWEGV